MQTMLGSSSKPTSRLTTSWWRCSECCLAPCPRQQPHRHRHQMLQQQQQSRPGGPQRRQCALQCSMLLATRRASASRGQCSRSRPWYQCCRSRDQPPGGCYHRPWCRHRPSEGQHRPRCHRPWCHRPCHHRPWRHRRPWSHRRQHRPWSQHQHLPWCRSQRRQHRPWCRRQRPLPMPIFSALRTACMHKFDEVCTS